ncbi:MAG: ethanolamine utilization protein EutN [Deltaproteobacteria bacterium RIFOXYA12_FULL_58_15]|nr:MAG: ethanolamine utilization protein EutN [Deltaproteobacteria bacterium RIFOXYA12_FULL_58_15]OGR13259.1 MAG: ethanolamine utilization protein EutN [Deltaproteobacteria bacterium RIFOXYB12_FULL_58_9]
MLLARVIGSVVATRKEAELEGITFLLVENTEPDGKLKGSHVVAADAVGAGVGDLVLYATGSSARQTAVTRDRPCDATIMAIVDLVEEKGDFLYRKDDE